MAWRAQEARFLTCAGVIFNVKRCGRNRWPGELKSPFSDLCWRIFNVKRCDKVFPCWSFSGRAPPCRQGSADINQKTYPQKKSATTAPPVSPPKATQSSPKRCRSTAAWNHGDQRAAMLCRSVSWRVRRFFFFFNRVSVVHLRGLKS